MRIVMSLRDSERDEKEGLQSNHVAARRNRLKGTIATRGLAAFLMLAVLVLATGCGLPTRAGQKTTTTPISTPTGKRPLTLYTGTYGGWVYAMSAADGHERWRIRDRVWPLLADGMLYTAGPLGVEALSPTDGTVHWHVQLFDQPNRGIGTAPIIDHGVIYVAASGFNGVRFGEIDAVSTANGSVLWRYSPPGQNSGGIGGISPLVIDGNVYTAGDALYVLRTSDGHLIRRIETGGGGFWTKPAIQAGVAYITMNETPPSSGSAVEAIRLADGTRLWYKHISAGAARDLLVAGDTVYATGGIRDAASSTPGTEGNWYGLLYALHTSDGSAKWTFRTSGTFDWPPALDGNTLYAGSSAGYLNLIDRSSGALLRRYRVDDGQSTTQPYQTFWTIPVVRDGVIYFAFRAFDRLYVFHADGPAGHLFALRERDGAILWDVYLNGWVASLQMSAA